MERGANTMGRYARLLEGAEAIEIKATVPQKQVKAALARYGLTRSNDEQRFIYFFDTPRLDLLKAGIIARARRIVGDEHDSTIKFRPVDAAKVGKKWRKYRDFKIEADASEKGIVKSASFSMPVAKGLIKRVVAGEKSIAALFTEEQEAFLAEMAGSVPDLAKLSVLGPLMAQRWDFEDPACPWPITAELWTRADRATLMEVSVKAPAVQAAAVMAGFMAFLGEVGAERDNNQQAKTRWALDHYAGAAARQGRRRGPAARQGNAEKGPPDRQTRAQAEALGGHAPARVGWRLRRAWNPTCSAGSKTSSARIRTTAPVAPPQGFFAFLWACTEGLRPYILGDDALHRGDRRVRGAAVRDARPHRRLAGAASSRRSCGPSSAARCCCSPACSPAASCWSRCRRCSSTRRWPATSRCGCAGTSTA